MAGEAKGGEEGDGTRTKARTEGNGGSHQEAVDGTTGKSGGKEEEENGERVEEEGKEENGSKVSTQ